MKTLTTSFLITITLFIFSCDSKTNQLTNKKTIQEIDEALLDSIYDTAMASYERKDYKSSAEDFDLFFENKGNLVYNNGIYNAACVYTLNGEHEKALDWLEYVVEEKFYSNLDHIKSDEDLKNLHNYPKWKSLLLKVQQNIDTAPKRNREAIKKALFKAKEILASDNGKLWKVNLWDNKI